MSFLTILISSSFLFYSSYHSLLFSFSLSSLFITSRFTSTFSLSPLSSYSSIHSNHLPCLHSSSHLHHAHHLAYSSIIHPTSSSFHPPSIPSFSHFSLFHSSISPWCSSRFPQNSFSPISFIIPSSSLFHPPFLPISTPSPSSTHIPAFHSLSQLCSLSILFLQFPLIPLFSFLIPFISFLRFSSTCLNYSINTLFVRIVVIPFSFGVLIGNTLNQLDVTASAFYVWFESSSIEWSGNGRMRTWWLQGIGVLEAVITEVDSIGW